MDILPGQISYEEALEIIQDRRRLDPALQRFFGQDNIVRVLEIISSTEVAEMDALVISGELTPEACSEYIALVPEWHQIRASLFKIAEDILETLKPKLAGIVERSYATRRVRKNDLSGTIAKAKVLKKGNNRLTQLFNSIIKIFIQNDIKDDSVISISAVLLHRLTHHLTQLVGIVVFEEIKKQFGEDHAFDFFKDVNKSYVSAHGFTFPAKLILDSAALLKGCINDHRGKVEEMTETEEVNYQDILDLASTRNIFEHRVKSDGMEICIFGDEYRQDDPHGGSWLCMGFIVLDENENVPLPEVIKTPEGENNLIVRRTSRKFFDFHLDRVTGELCFSDSGIPISRFLKPEIYRKLKAKVHKITLDYLLVNEPDLTSLLIAEPTPTAARDEVADNIAWVYTPYEETGPSEQPTAEVETEEPSGLSQDDIDTLRRKGTLDSRRTLRALTSVAGEAVRVKGSHHIFENNGQTTPFAFHSGRDVTFKVIRSTLERLGIPISDFLRAY
jgi:predicted RNA binding protein YcfA (HicA-like mRNA interferase family)